MNLHANAALSLKKRRSLCRRVVVEGRTVTEPAAAAEVSVRCARKWVGRYPARGELGLLDRSSAPRRVANRTDERRVEAIAALRRLRFTGPEIAETLAMPLSTTSGILTRIGTGRLGRLGLEPAQRYEREQPGELIHIDVKKLGRIRGGAGKRITGVKRNPRRTRVDRDGHERKIIGWEYVHIAIDDCTRLAYAEVLPNEKATTAIAFLRPRQGVLRAARHDRRAAPDRQRLRLPLHDPRDRLQNARHPPPPQPPLQAPDQRQSRTLHPHPSRRLGLRRDLPRQPRSHPSA
jgi:hypothetical protein